MSRSRNQPRSATPRKILHITDAAFILPDDFHGSIQDAMKLFLDYHNTLTNKPHAEIKTDYSRLFTPMGILSFAPGNIKCCIDAKLYELSDDGYYVEMNEDE